MKIILFGLLTVLMFMTTLSSCSKSCDVKCDAYHQDTITVPNTMVINHRLDFSVTYSNTMPLDSKRQFLNDYGGDVHPKVDSNNVTMPINGVACYCYQ